jgi:hypothetical protein
MKGMELISRRPASGSVSPTLGLADAVTLAVWAGALTGVVEGVLLTAAIAWPAILAPYKASAHQLWISPIVDIVAFTFATGILWSGLQLTKRARILCSPRSAVALLGCASIGTIAVTLNVIHFASAGVLAIGGSAALSRAFDGREHGVVRILKRRLWAIPLIIMSIAMIMLLSSVVTERAAYAALPPVSVRGH